MEKYVPRRAQCLKYDDEEEILSLLNTLGQCELPFDFQRLSSKTNTVKDAYIAFEDAVHNLSGVNAGNKRSCASYSKNVCLENVSSLRKGQQISMLGHFARKFFIYLPKIMHIYEYHAIIKEISHKSETMEVIHFTEEDKKTDMNQSVKTYDPVQDGFNIIDYGKRIHQLPEIEIGDVVLLKYYKIEHEVLVTELRKNNEVSKISRIWTVHYGIGLFGTQKFMEENFTINPMKSAVQAIFLNNKPDLTVMLAKKSVGEKKLAMILNRSDYFCYCAKVKQSHRSICMNLDNGHLGTSSTNDLRSLYTRSTEVYLENDMCLGDFIKYEKTGILNGKEVIDNGRGRNLKNEMTVYDWRCFFGKMSYTVDLKKDRIIIIKDYDPTHCHPIAIRSDRTNGLEEDTTTEKDAFIAFEDAEHKLSEANADSKISCVRCSKPFRVENVFSLRKGQHISMPGRNSRKFVKKCHKMVHIYQHHAIIKEIRHKSGTRIEMELIHFTKESNKIDIFKSIKMYDLVYDELYIIKYVHPRFTADEIVRRAESMLPTNNDGQYRFGTYNPFTNNCEHFATWCVVGEGQSLQCQAWVGRIVNLVKRLLEVRNKIEKINKGQFKPSWDEIEDGFTKCPESVLVGTLVFYCMHNITMTIIHYIEFRKRRLCNKCLKGKLKDLWISFAVFGGISIFTFVSVKRLLDNQIKNLFVVMLSLLSIKIQWNVSNIREALQSPFVDNGKRIVEQLSDIEIGDVALLKYFKIEHAVIVTEVHEDNEVATKGRIRVVHYGLQILFGTLEIVEEYLTINLRKSPVKVIDCSNLLTNTPDTTVMLARKRVGERKWALTSNRSDHLCLWAKFKQRPRSICENWNKGYLGTSSTKDSSSLSVGRTEVFLENDLHLGDVIEYEKTGILVGKEVLDIDKGRRFRIEMIVYDWGWYVCKKSYTVDLNKDRITIRHYHPAHCHPMAVRKDRANGLEGRKGTWWTNNGFIKHCIMSNPRQVTKKYKKTGTKIP